MVFMILNKMIRVVSIIMIIIAFAGCNQHAVKQGNKKTHQKTVVTPPPFNSDSAYYFVKKQVEFGPRVPGSKAHSECASWLISKLKQFNAQVTAQKFKVRTYDGVTRNGINIIASYNPDVQKRVLLMSHWDSRPFADYDKDSENHNTPIDGANDGASGVGVLMEMARQFGIKNPGVGVDIVLFDLEDWGPPHDLQISYNEEYWGLGSQFWSKNPHTIGYNANYGILLDMVGAKDPEFRKEAFSQRDAEFVVDLVWNTASDMGYGSYFINEQGGAITDDHFFVNKYAGIPSIDIIHLDPSNNTSGFFEHWHTLNDNIETIDPKSLEIVGDVLMMIVYNE